MSYRLLTPIGTRGRRYPGLAATTALVLVGVLCWATSGPTRAGWNAIANAGGGSGSRLSSSSTTLESRFSAQVQGTVQSSPTGLTLQVAFTAGTRAQLIVTLRGSAGDDGGLVVTSGTLTLGPLTAPAQYTGSVTQLTGLSGGVQLAGSITDLNGHTLSVQARLVWTGRGPVTGTLLVQPQGA